MTNEDYEMIEAYMNNELTGDDLQQFQQRLSADEEFAKEVNLYGFINDNMKTSIQHQTQRQQLNKTLTQLGNQHFKIQKEKSKIVSFNRFKWLAAAAAVFAIIISVYLLTNQNQLSSQQLYTEHAKYNSISFERGNTDSALLIPVKFYNSKNYAAAIPFFETYLKQYPANTEIALTLNICRIETGLYDNAINGLDSIIAKQNAFLYQAQWLKALAYLKQDKKEECKNILEQIPPEADTYAEAQSLLKRLK